MTRLTIDASALVAALVGSELALGGTKLQSGLARVLVVWMGAYVAAMCWLLRQIDPGVIAFTVFWGGAFLVWFGMRSHLESSILLRMLFLLRRRPMTDACLVREYASLYGESMRLEELCRGGLVVKGRDGMCVTSKGRAILLLVSKLR